VSLAGQTPDFPPRLFCGRGIAPGIVFLARFHHNHLFLFLSSCGILSFYGPSFNNEKAANEKAAGAPVTG
jgi:hypothetical protein